MLNPRQRSVLTRVALCAGLLAGSGVAPAGPDAGTTPANPPDTIADIQARGALHCGVGEDVRGLATRVDNGHWRGLEIDFCRAVAAAVLGNADKAVPVPLTVEERFRALRDGQVDLLLRNTTWTSSRDITEGVSFVGVLLLDGQGFMVPRATATLSARQLDGARLCAVANTTSPGNAKDWFAREGLTMTLVLQPTLEAAATAYLAGKCDALTSDQTQLHSLRATLPQPDAQRILPELIAKELLGPVVREGDPQWFALVRWTLFTLLEAEELGISSRNVSIEKTRGTSSAVRALLDLDGSTGKALGVSPEWSYRVLLAVGNYAEMFDRNLGDDADLEIPRGRNALWRDGGLLYSPPMR